MSSTDNNNNEQFGKLVDSLKSPDVNVCLEALKSLAHTQDNRILPYLIELLADENEEVSDEADNIISNMDKEITLPLLLDKLKTHLDYKVRANIAWFLVDAFKEDQIFKPLLEAVDDLNNEVQESVIDCLGRIGSSTATHTFIRKLSVSNNKKVRIAAAMALGKLKNNRAVEPLIEIVKNLTEPYELRMHAIMTLGYLKDSNAIELLIASLETDVADSAIGSLGWVGDERATKPLLKKLENANAERRSSIAKALGTTGDKQAIEPLTNLLNDEDEQVRFWATISLGRLGDSNVFDRLVEYLTIPVKSKKNYYYKWAVIALGSLGDKRAIEPIMAATTLKTLHLKEAIAESLGKLRATQAADLLSQWLNDEDELVGMKAAAALGQIGTDQAINYLIQALNYDNEKVLNEVEWAIHDNYQQAIKPLIHALKTSPHPKIRANAAHRLIAPYYSDDESALPPLMEAMQDESGEVRSSVVYGIGTIRNQLATDIVIKALINDVDEEVRENAANALGKIQDQKAVQPLIEVLQNPDEAYEVRKEAAYSLGYLKNVAAVEILIENLDRDIGHVAAFALGHLKDNRAVEPLIKALKDEDADMRRNAAHSLADIGDKRAIEPLALLLSDEDEKVRFWATVSLGRLGDHRAFESLMTCLTTPVAKHLSYRYMWCAMGLGEIGDKRAIAPLIKTLAISGSSEFIRSAIAEALGKLQATQAIEPLINLLTSDSIMEGVSAAKALGQIGDKRALPTLQTLLEKTEQQELKDAATEAIELIKVSN